MLVGGVLADSLFHMKVLVSVVRIARSLILLMVLSLSPWLMVFRSSKSASTFVSMVCVSFLSL